MNDIVLKLNDVSKILNGFAISKVSMAFFRGQIASIIGPNGAGKTTLLDLISGFLRLDDGEIYNDRQRIDGLPPWEIARRGIGRIFQDVRVFNKLTTLENVALAYKEQPGENPLISLFSRRKSRSVERRNIEDGKRWLRFVGLSDKERDLAEDLSYGQQKLLSVARLLAGGYDILLLDEPTAGVDEAMVKTICSMLKKMAGQGKTVVLVEHNIRVVADISDHVEFLCEGKVTISGVPGEVLNNPEVRGAYIGI